MPARGAHSGAHTHTAAQGGTVQEGKLRSGGISKSPKAVLLERGRAGLSLQPSQAQAGSRGQSLEVELASFPSGCPDQFCSLWGVLTREGLYLLLPLTSPGGKGWICWVLTGLKYSTQVCC